MSVFQWSATDVAGEEQTGTMRAPDRQTVVSQLLKQKLNPNEIVEADAPAAVQAAPVESGPRDMRHWSFVEWFGIMVKAIPAAWIVMAIPSLIILLIWLVMAGKLR